MLASAFALTNCSEELVDPDTLTDQVTQDGVNSPESSKGVPFTIYASAGSEADTKTQVVRDENGKTLKTEWVEGDVILAVYENKDGSFYGPIEFTVDPANLEDGKFTTENFPEEVLRDEINKYNWYFTYGLTTEQLTVNSGSVSASVTISGNTQTQNTETDMELEHLGINCPMLGKALNLSGPVFPRVQMEHLATLHEVTVQNKTQDNTKSGAKAGNIVVYSFAVSTSTQGSWDKSNRINLTGTFKLDLKTGKLQNVAGADIITLNLQDDQQKSSSVTIASGSEYKFYFVTAPIDKLQINATIENYYLTKDPTQTITVDAYNALSDAAKASYKANIIRKDELNFFVNGSHRPTLTEKTFENFSGGRVKRFILPIKEMQSPLASDAVNIQTRGRNGNSATALTDAKNLVTVGTGNNNTTSITVNGSSGVNAYILDNSAVGSNSDKIIIKGFVKDMINALPIGFYASQWNNQPTAMTISSINMWLPEYNTSGILIWKTYDFHKYKNRAQINSYSLISLASGIISGMGLSLGDGIQREELVKFIDPTNITFSGMPANGLQDATKGNNFVVMYEDATYKDINIDLINYFLKNKFSTTQDNTYYEASYEGLIAILNADMDYNNGNLTYKAYGNYTAAQMEQFAKNTASGIYYKISQVLDSRITAGGTLLTLLVKDPTHFMHILRDMEIELVISTYPYSGSTYTPIVFWGLDAAN